MSSRQASLDELLRVVRSSTRRRWGTLLGDDEALSLAVALSFVGDNLEGNRLSVNLGRVLNLSPNLATNFAKLCGAALKHLEKLHEVSIMLSEEDDSEYDGEDETSDDEEREDGVSEDDGDIDSAEIDSEGGSDDYGSDNDYEDGAGEEDTAFDEENNALGDDGRDDGVGEDDEDSDDAETNSEGDPDHNGYENDYDDDSDEQEDNSGFGDDDHNFIPILESFLEGLAEHSKVSFLELRSVPVGGFLAKFLLEATQRLKTLSFVHCRAAADDLSATLEAVSKSQIEELHFEGFGEPQFFLDVVKAATQVGTLRVLKIWDVLWSRKVETEVFKYISGTHLTDFVLNGHGELTETLVQGIEAASIVKLNLSLLSFTQQGMSAFRSYLCNVKCLREFWMHTLQLDPRHFHELMAGLSSSKTLRVLGLVSCLKSDSLVGHLSEYGAMIGKLLEDNHHLEYLALADNGLTNEVLAGIASGLRANRVLSSLVLGSNRISDATQIAHALRLNTSLTSLDLRQNMISTAAMWCEVLVDRATPLELNLMHCPLSDDALVDLSLTLSRQGHLKKLQVGYWPHNSPPGLFTGGGIAPFLQSVQTNVHLKDLELLPDTWDSVAFDALVEVLPLCVSLRSLDASRLWSEAQVDRKQRFLNSLKQNKSLFQVKVGVCPCFQCESEFYMLRNRVDYALGAYSAATRSVLLERVLGWPSMDVGLSVVLHIFKTCPTILDSARRGISRPQSANTEETSKPEGRPATGEA